MTAPTSFGVGMISAQRPLDDERPFRRIYEELIELCEFAESLGYATAWLSEHHFVDDGYMSGLLPVAAAIAARTTTLQVGTGILVAPLHDPLRLAEDAATVDVISGGRLILGIGAGYRDEEFAGFGREKKGLGPVLDSTIGVLRGAWRGDVVQGSADSAGVKVSPLPHRLGGPPVWIGARTDAGIRRVGRSADGLIAARVTPQEFGEQVQTLRDAVAEAGRDPGDLTVATHCPVFVSDAPDARGLFEPYLHYSEWKYKDMVGQPYGSRSQMSAPGPLSDKARETIWASAIIGGPEQVAERIAEYEQAAGDFDFHFIPRLYWPGMDRQMQRDVVAEFAEQVMPLWKDANGSR